MKFIKSIFFIILASSVQISFGASKSVESNRLTIAQAGAPAMPVANQASTQQNKQIAAQAAAPEATAIKCQYLCMNLNGNGTKLEMTPMDLNLKNPPKFGFQCQFNPNDLSSTCDKFLEPFIQDGIKQIKEECKNKKKSEIDLIIPVMMVCF